MKFKEKYQIDYCELCETWMIACPDCEFGSCSGGGCPKCSLDFDDFNKFKKTQRFVDQSKTVDSMINPLYK